jgi:phosphatidylserine decarboxylase
MRIPLTKYGLPQVVVYPLTLAGLMLACPLVWVHTLSDAVRAGGLGLALLWAVEVVLFGLLIWTLSFFRDPPRLCPPGSNILLAPADGRIMDIRVVQSEYIGDPALRIGIFLSIFDTHINRSPCNATVVGTTYRRGRYKNAMSPESSRVNESNDIALVRTDAPNDRLVVRQISGAIARRIVCDLRQGQQLAGGEKFGMIKFGSRTELYLPARHDVKCLVQTGDKVKAGLTALVRYESCEG